MRPSCQEDANVTRLYVKALKSLQRAFEDPEHCVHAETLYPTELLALFEVSLYVLGLSRGLTSNVT